LEYPLENLNFNERNEAFDFITQPDNGWTMVAVTNDDCFAKRADKIAIMENGAIVKVGTYEEMKNIANFKTY
jgi:ABC-type cobalamin/Fe3+-siderophores transport system ATPase subunit